MKMKHSICFAILLFSLASCRDRAQNDVFLIPSDQVPGVIKTAEAGDLKSVKALILHYESSRNGDALAEKWRAKARSLGDAQELYYYAADIYTTARKESNPLKRKKMLSDALTYARSSYASAADPSTKHLVDEIGESLRAAGP